MPKNLKGGKQFKKKAKQADVDLSTFTIDRQPDQQIARAIRLLGNRNILCYCNDNKVRNCHVRGKMMGRVFIDVGDVVLVSLREFEEGSSKSKDQLKGDILAKYPYDCLTNLKKEEGINPKLFMQLETLEGARLVAIGDLSGNAIVDNEDGFEFDREDGSTDGEESELDIDDI